jgi:sugar O-acyltransferase (sialic acid O-acetyltransferase NeuD family)
MSKPKLVLIGAGGHARSCIDVIECEGSFQIAGLVEFSRQSNEKRSEFDHAVVGIDDDLSELSKIHQYALIAIGQILSAEPRIRLYQKVTQLGFQLPIIISPTAYVSRFATLGAGTVVMHGAIINAGANIGNNCIINSRALIEHDVKVGDHCHISTGAILNGDVVVGSETFIGSGSVLKQGISIGNNCLIGMGITVRHNLPDFTAC